jgi:YesN/AraC family two-component response regulator
MAANGTEALEICRKFEPCINLLLTDLAMPGINGIRLAEEVSQHRPEIKVVMMSGGFEDSVLSGNIPHAFLIKPFVPPILLETIQEVLDGQRSAPVEV